jgi:hypothetical protein
MLRITGQFSFLKVFYKYYGYAEWANRYRVSTLSTKTVTVFLESPLTDKLLPLQEIVREDDAANR